jgi:ATP-binding cassette subfamily B protein
MADEASSESWRQRWRVLPRLLRLLWEVDRRDVLLVGALSLVNGLRPLLSLLVLQRLIDSALAAITHAAPLRDALLWLAAWFLIEALQTILDLLYGLIAHIQERMRARVQERLLRKASRLSLAAFERPAAYDQLQRAQQALDTRLTTLLDSIVPTPIYLVQAASLLIYVGSAHLFFPLVILLGQLITYGAYTHYFRRSYWLDRKQAAPLRALRYLGELMVERRVAGEIRLFGLGAYLLERYQRLFGQLRDERLKLARDRQRTDLIRVAGKALNTGLVVVGLVVLIARRALSVGAFVAYLSAAERLSEAIAMIVTWGIGQADNGLRYMQDLFDYLDLEEEHTGAARAELRRPPLVRFENVSFAYPGAERPVLDGVSLTLVPGERIALVGENGAGKTTLAKLLLGLYRPSEGRIMIDGLDLATLDLHWWRGCAAAVFQNYVRYELTARENIGFGDLARLEDEQAIAAAAMRSGAATDVASLPAGYATVLGKAYDERGSDLSIGQWQKLAIARAYLRDALVLVLDEPTSALDARAEVEVYRRFRDMAQGRTTLLISHRLGAARLADRILLLEGGKVLEQGDHRALLELGGRYAQLYRVQAEWYGEI